MQILLNFLSNAIKFTYDNHTITIRVILLEVQNIDSIDQDDQSENML